MEAWMAFVSIMAIVAIVVVAGGLIAFIGHMIIGAFDSNKQATKTNVKEVIDYAQYKQLENGAEKVETKEYDFEAINEAKAQEEKSLLEEEKEEDVFKIDEEDDENLEEIENRLKEANAENSEEDVDMFDLDNMLEEISNDVIEEEKAEAEETVKISDELESYSIDELLKQSEEEVEEIPETEEKVEEVEIEEDQTEEVVEEPVVDNRNEEIESLKAQLAELNKQLEEARSAKVEVVTIDMTEEECVARLEMLEERLKNVKKDYKTNAKEYRPLKKVMNDLDRYQTKLRRKEAVVAKKKVALYGVNNYVDIDKEKAEKLANELELLDGLRLSVSHCEEVINANKDRFPVLEHTNSILEDQISHIEADIETTQVTLQKIRDKKGNGEGSNEQ